MQLETVKIVAPVSDDNKLGYIVINKDDLTDADTLFVEKPAKKSKQDEPAAE